MLIRSSAHRATPRALALALAIAAVVLLALAPPPAGARSGARPRPPEEMSEIGGELLGRSGTQVRPEDGAPKPPDGISSKAWIVADAESGEVLAARNAHWPLAPASTIKMLFADTLLPKFDRDDLYRARPEHFTGMGAGSSAVGISDFQTYTVEDLWHGVLLVSGNDAVHALSAMNGGKKTTVEEMNARAEELQALDTHVVNPDGYDARGQTSSAYDLTLFARSAMRNADFRDYVSTATYDFPGAGRGENRETYQIQNTNRLLVGDVGLDPYPGIAGVKNGYTSNAGYTFTGVAERGDRVLLVTCLDPKGEGGDGLEVYREAAALLDWGFEAAGRVEPVGELVPPLSEVQQQEQEQAGEAQGDGEETDPALSGAAGADEEAGGGAGTVVAVTAAALVLLAAGAYAFHRRHPLPLPRPGRRDEDGPVV
ncbi:D-alanyl-D-alanine carboxypeptidase family protein [Streptomyces sp. 6N223]|uniref:D-alanyl-D-alanine carboxypeptidase family protein n=1 Tax=Streptomyces sp. 6N223 TaxID=3457412 RepID=UPI003FCFFC06